MEQQAMGSQRKDVSLGSGGFTRKGIYMFFSSACLFESLPAWLDSGGDI